MQSERTILVSKYIRGGYNRHKTCSYNDTCVRTSRRTREILRWICTLTPKAVKKGQYKLYFNFGENNGVGKRDIEKLKSVDIKKVDKSLLSDIKDIRINGKLPVEERIADFMRQPTIIVRLSTALRLNILFPTTMLD